MVNWNLDQNYLVFVVDDATQQMNNSIVARGRRGENTWAGLVFYIWELGYCNQMSVVLINQNKRCWQLVPLIVILPTSPRLVVGARVDWQQFFR